MVAPWTWGEAEDRRGYESQTFRRSATSSVFSKLAAVRSRVRDAGFGWDEQADAFRSAASQRMADMTWEEAETRRGYGQFVGRAVTSPTRMREARVRALQAANRRRRRPEEEVPTTFGEAETRSERAPVPRAVSTFGEAEDRLAREHIQATSKAVGDVNYRRQRREELAQKYERQGLTRAENEEMIRLETQLGGGRGFGALASGERGLPNTREELLEAGSAFLSGQILPPEALEPLGRVPVVGRQLERSARFINTPVGVATLGRFPGMTLRGEAGAIAVGSGARRVHPSLEVPGEIVGDILAPNRVPAGIANRLVGESGEVLRGGIKVRQPQTLDKLIAESERTLGRRLPSQQRVIQQRRLYELQAERDIATAVRQYTPETALNALSREAEEMADAIQVRGAPQISTRRPGGRGIYKGVTGDALVARLDTFERFLGNARFVPPEQRAAERAAVRARQTARTTQAPAPGEQLFRAGERPAMLSEPGPRGFAATEPITTRTPEIEIPPTSRFADQATLEGVRAPGGGNIPPGGGGRQTGVSGMPPEEPPYRGPTLTELNRQLTPEQRLMRMGTPRQSIYTPGEDVSRTVQNAVGPLGRDALRVAQEVAQKVAPLRWFGSWMDPEAAAKIQQRRGNKIPMAALERDVYSGIEKTKITADLGAWAARNQDLLGLRRGIATAITLKEGVKDVPKKAISRLDDIIENLDDYNISPQQRVALQELQDTQQAMLQAQLRKGMNIKEWQDNYYARMVTKTPKGERVGAGVGGGRTLRVRQGSAKPRSFDKVRDGYRAGYEYADPLEALEMRLSTGVDSIANQHVLNRVKLEGVLPSSRIKQETADAMAEAAEQYKGIRRTGVQEDIEIAAEEYKRIRDAWRHEVDIARSPRLGETYAYGRIIPEDVMDELNKYYDIRGKNKGIYEGFDEIAQLVRATRVSMDMSALGVQGAVLAFHNNPAWWKAVTLSVAAAVKEPRSFYANNLHVINDMADYRLGSPPTEMLLRSGGPLSQMFGRVPVVKQLQRAFEWFIFVGQVEMWKATGYKHTSAAAKREIASVIRKETGIVLRPGLTKGQEALDRTLFFAPAFARAVVGLPMDALRMGDRGTEARGAMAHLAAGYVAMTTAAQLREDGTLPNWTDFHDREKPWGMVVTEGGSFSLLGPLYPYVKAFGSASQHVAEGNPDKAAKDMQFLAQGRASIPLAAALNWFVTGTDPNTGQPIEAGWKGLGEFLKGQVGPIGVSEVAGGSIANLITEPGEVGERLQNFPYQGLELAGVRTQEFTPAIRRNIERDQAGQRLFGKDYDDPTLDQRQRDEIDAQPEVQEWVGEARERSLELGSEYEVYRQEYAAIDEQFRGEFERLRPYAEEVLRSGSQEDKQALRDLIDEKMRDRARDLENLRTRYEQAGTFDFDSPEQQREAEFDLARADYIAQIYDDALENPITGEYNFSERDSRMAALEAKYGADMIAQVEDYNRRNEHPLVTELRDARDMLAPYWDIADSVWAEAQRAVPETRQYESLEDYKDAKARQYEAEGMSPEAARVRVERHDFVGKVNEFISDGRDKLRKQNPAIDAALIKWGYAGTPIGMREKKKPPASSRYGGTPTGGSYRTGTRYGGTPTRAGAGYTPTDRFGGGRENQGEPTAGSRYGGTPTRAR